MRIAILSDIHGNIDALEAVLADCDKQHADAYAFLGDLVCFGLHPQECFDALMARNPIVRIKGNTDANLEEVETFIPSTDFERQLLDCIRDCNNRLATQAKREIRVWPIAERQKLTGTEIMFCHGSPYSFNDKLRPDGVVDPGLAQRLTKDGSPTLFCGHTHMPGMFSVGDIHITNVGAVGYSFDGDPRASYCLLDRDGRRQTSEIHRVAYDREHYLAELAQITRELPLFKSIWFATKHGKPMQI